MSVLNNGGCPVENAQPPCIAANLDQNGLYSGIKPGLQQAARAAFENGKANPQLIVVILPVSFPLCRSMHELIPSEKSR